MQVCSLDVKKNIFRPRDDNEELLGLEVPYNSAIGALIYFDTTTWLDVAFSVSLLAKYKFSPIKRLWNEIKHILPYLWGTIGIRLFYSNKSNFDLVLQILDIYLIHIKLNLK